MIKIKIKPKDQLDLTEIFDYVSNTVVGIGTEGAIYDESALTAADSTYSIHVLYSVDKFPDEYYKEIYVISGNLLVPIHESWIESIIDENGVEHTITHTKPWLTSTLIKLNTPHYFLNIDTLEIVFNDNCCSSCGAPLEDVAEFGICSSCEEELVNVKNYSYKPEPVFFGTSPVNKFYGIELEYGFNTKKDALKVIAPHSSALYLKSDSSIRGGEFQAELVSHPHTFEQLMDPSSFIHTVAKAAVQPREENGCHIHISRTSFTDQKHYALFYFLVYASKEFLEFVGGRTLNSYCKYQPVGKVFTKENAQNPSDRAVVINESNANTVEIRIFKSTNNTAEIKRFIQFIDSAIEYTRQAKKQVSLTNYFKYIKANVDRYDMLSTSIANYKGSVADPIMYRAPIIKDIKASSLTLTDLSNITTVRTSNETVRVDFTSSTLVLRNGSRLEFNGFDESGSQSNNLRTYTINLADITSLRVVR